MRTKCGLEGPPSRPTFEGPFPPGNGPSAVPGGTVQAPLPGWLTGRCGRGDHRSSQDALDAATSIHRGGQPDVLNNAGGWKTPIWP